MIMTDNNNININNNNENKSNNNEISALVLENNLIVQVEQIETNFIKGNFRLALATANKFLITNKLYRSNNNNNNDNINRKNNTDTIIVLQNPIQFEFESTLQEQQNQRQQPNQQQQQQHQQSNSSSLLLRTFAIQTNNSTEIDIYSNRVSAVALQSWYEISKTVTRATSTSTSSSNSNTTSSSTFTNYYDDTTKILDNQGLQHLYPFLNYYSCRINDNDDDDDNSNNDNNNQLPLIGMSIELFLIFIQFVYNALYDINVVLILCESFLFLFRTDTLSKIMMLNETQKKNVQEIVYYIFTTIIPECASYDPIAIDNFLTELSSSNKKYNVCSNKYVPRITSTTIIHNNRTILTTSSISSKNDIKNGIQISLQFCNTKESLFVQWLDTTFCNCRKSLSYELQQIHRTKQQQQQQMKQMINKNQDDDDDTSTINPNQNQDNNNSLSTNPNNGKNTTLFTVRLQESITIWKSYMTQFCINNMFWKAIRNPRELLSICTSSSYKDFRNILPVRQGDDNTTRYLLYCCICLLLLIGWFKKRKQILQSRLYKNSTMIGTLLWNELFTIMEAFGISSSSTSTRTSTNKN